MDWGIWIPIALGLVAIGYAALAVSKPHVAAARFFFVMAAAVLLAVVVEWDMLTSKGAVIRIGLIAIAGASLAVLMSEGLRYTTQFRTRPASSNPPSPISAPMPVSKEPSLNPVVMKSGTATSQSRPKRTPKPKVTGPSQADLEATGRATAFVDRLRGEYIGSHDGISSAMLAGTEPLPDEWVNKRLNEVGIPYSYHGQPDGGYTLAPNSKR